jgi:hypothetical protein
MLHECSPRATAWCAEGEPNTAQQKQQDADMIVLSMIFPGSIDSRTLGKRVAERLLVFLLVFGLVPKLAEREGMTDASFF